MSVISWFWTLSPGRLSKGPVLTPEQSDASEELLLSARQVSSILFVLATHKRGCSQGFMEILTRMVSRDGSRVTPWVSRRLMGTKGVLSASCRPAVGVV